jgi:Domain of unknown function (DUF4743)
MATLLPIILACDNFRVGNSPEALIPFYIHVPPKQGDATIGFLRPSILEQLEQYNRDLISSGVEPIWDIVAHPQAAGGPGFSTNESRSRMVGFVSSLATATLRSTAMEIMLQKWYGSGEPFGDLIAGKMWRNELYPIYYQPFTPSMDNLAFSMERAATPLFGVVTYGVHLTVYTSDYRIWIPRRAKTKQTLVSYSAHV